MTCIIAAAGIAEAAWAQFACMLVLSMGVVGVLTLFALALQSRRLAVTAAGLHVLATLFFQPWYCFSPFEEAAYADSDVQSAAGMFWKVGIIWAVTSAAVVTSLLFGFLFPGAGSTASPLPPTGTNPSLPAPLHDDPAEMLQGSGANGSGAAS